MCCVISHYSMCAVPQLHIVVVIFSHTSCLNGCNHIRGSLHWMTAFLPWQLPLWQTTLTASLCEAYRDSCTLWQHILSMFDGSFFSLQLHLRPYPNSWTLWQLTLTAAAPRLANTVTLWQLTLTAGLCDSLPWQLLPQDWPMLLSCQYPMAASYFDSCTLLQLTLTAALCDSLPWQLLPQDWPMLLSCQYPMAASYFDSCTLLQLTLTAALCDSLPWQLLPQDWPMLLSCQYLKAASLCIPKKWATADLHASNWPHIN
jgi:hypothetical protein